MLTLSKILLVIAGIGLIVDGIFMMFGLPNIANPAWPLPCPTILIVLGLGIILYIFSGRRRYS